MKVYPQEKLGRFLPSYVAVQRYKPRDIVFFLHVLFKRDRFVMNIC